MDRFIPYVTQEEIKREKQKARVLKKSSWWRKKISKRKCYYCGKEVPENKLTMDHLIPLIRGGKSVKSNIVPACKDCNHKKRYMLPLEWEQYLNSLNSFDFEKIL
jgi:5-methylcytosine-specific restriction protein A